tara:strand:- start:2128 stop:2451 length:324 start_codon:yes stop_codon:yes gene_type:complete
MSAISSKTVRTQVKEEFRVRRLGMAPKGGQIVQALVFGTIQRKRSLGGVGVFPEVFRSTGAQVTTCRSRPIVVRLLRFFVKGRGEESQWLLLVVMVVRHVARLFGSN